MDKIASFTVDHDYITEGMYISRIDGDITTFDLRTRKPNAGDYMDNLTMHSVEHMVATLIRNSEISKDVIYFGPMGCRTGFYLLFKGEVSVEKIKPAIIKCFEFIKDYEGEIPGASAVECGNYLDLNLDMAKYYCKIYRDSLAKNKRFVY